MCTRGPPGIILHIQSKSVLLALNGMLQLLAMNQLTTLSIAQNRAIAKERKQRERQAKKCSQELVAVWAMAKFSLKRPPSQEVMSRIFKDSRLLEDTDSIAVYRERGTKNKVFEKDLLDWVCECNTNGKASPTVSFSRKWQISPQNAPSSSIPKIRFC